MVVGVIAGYVLARRILARRARSVAALTDRQREVLRAGACEGLVLHLLPDGARIDVAHGLRRLDQRDRGHEPAELIDRVEGLLHRADAWYAGVIAVALDRVHDQAWYAGLLEDRLPVLGM